MMKMLMMPSTGGNGKKRGEEGKEGNGSRKGVCEKYVIHTSSTANTAMRAALTISRQIMTMLMMLSMPRYSDNAT